MAQLLAQGIQELVCVAAARWAGKGEQLPAAGQRVWTTVRVLRGGGGALQADVWIGVQAALVVDLIHGSGERLLPGQRQAGFTTSCKEGRRK